MNDNTNNIQVNTNNDNEIRVLDIRDLQKVFSKPINESKHIKNLAAVEKYRPYAVGGLETMLAHWNSTKNKPHKIPTGIPELSNAIGGGYSVGGLCVVGGNPNVGKTTLMVQSAVKMAEEGIPSVFLSLDMSGNEIVDKVYSSISYAVLGSKGYTIRDIQGGKFLYDTKENAAVLKKFIQICSLFNVVDMLDNASLYNGVLSGQEIQMEMFAKVELLLNFYTQLFNHPTIFIDNLQQLVGYSGKDGKIGVDETLNKLKQWAREYEVPIVLISTLSRSSYDKPMELSSFKESGNIDYAVSQAVGIEPKFITDNNPNGITMDDFREGDRRDITIKCLKSRDSGFVKKYMTLNAPFCTFETYDEEHPNDCSKKKKNGRVTFVA